MRIYRFFIAAAALTIGLSSCNVTKVDGVIDAPDSFGPIVVKTIEGNGLSAVDTLSLKGGCFKFCPELSKDQPEFYYLFKDEVKLASLVLSRGDKVSVKCDTLGSWTVEGSEACEKLRQVEILCAKAVETGPVMMKTFIEHRRNLLKYVLENTHSITVVPVLFSRLSQIPVFAQPTDAILFTSVADSLETLYPNSRYVRMLRAEGEARMNEFKVQSMIDNAAAAAYPEISLPNIQGKNVSLTESAKKATLLVFWDASDPTHKIYNLDTLVPLWEQFQAAGLQIYQVALGQDKGPWALAVREQKLPWINVSDTRGTAMNLYAVMQVPSFYLLTDNGITMLQDYSLAALTKAVAAALK